MDQTTDTQKDINTPNDRNERRKAYCKAYREANKERRKAWYQANKVRITRVQRELRMFKRQEQQSNDTKHQD